MAASKKDLFHKEIKADSNKHRGKSTLLPLRALIADSEIQSREEVNPEVIAEYAEAMLSGSIFPELVIYKDENDNHFIADGFHRFYAAKEAGIKEISCEIKIGSKRDAILFSVGANATHGLRRTNKDKRKAVLTLLNDTKWCKFSNTKIAELTGVNDKTVGNIRKEYDLNQETIIGQDGREYNIKATSEIPKSKSRKKMYRVSLDLEYKDTMKTLVQKSKLKEKALLKEAINYLREKYDID
jgi:hypothetical protein